MKVYLAGPINGMSDAEAKDWRADAREVFAGFGWEVLDPMARDYRGKEDESVDQIVEGDKADIDAADIVIAYCPQPSVGTSMEVFYCWTLKKPCYVVVPDGRSVSPWLRYHASGVYESVRVAAWNMKAAA